MGRKRVKEGYIICRWVQDYDFGNETKRDVCVGWMPLRDAEDVTPEDVAYTGLYKAFERYVTKGHTTEILEVVSHPWHHAKSLGARVSWWRRQMEEIYGE